MLKGLLAALLLTSTLHAEKLPDLNVSYKTHWNTRPILKVEPIPQKNPEIQNPKITAKASLVIDLKSGKILYENNSEVKSPIASLTKLMTALIIGEEEKPGSLAKVSESAAQTGGSMVGLNANDKIKIQDLMYGMLIASGNDAAVALAEFNAQTVEHFVKKMNQKAERLSLKNTHFSNPMGFDETDNYSTARDLGMLSMMVLKNDFIREAAQMPHYKLKSTNGIEYEILTTNKLLEENIGIEGIQIQGLKTGRTPEAGECLINVARYPQGGEILTIVLGSQDRFQDTKNLIHWVYNSYRW